MLYQKYSLRHNVQPSGSKHQISNYEKLVYISNQPQLTFIFPRPPIMSYRKVQSLRDMLTDKTLTLSLPRRPKRPVKYGTQLKNPIFLKQENHVSTLVLKQTLAVSLNLESQ